MRRLATLILLTGTAAVAAAGCSSTDDGHGDAGGTRLASWDLEALSFPPPAPAGRRAGHPAPAGSAPAPSHHAASTPPPASATGKASAGETASNGAPSDAEIAAELKQAFRGKTGDGSIVDAAALTTADLATVPPSAPAKVADIIQAGNQVARRPYVYGGGHGGGPEGLFVDSAYDCSGSVSFALAAAGLIKSPMDSTALSHYGKAGPGKWVTIYANAGHAWMTVAGLRFDTSGRSEHGSRWQSATRSTAGFTVRHPPGL